MKADVRRYIPSKNGGDPRIEHLVDCQVGLYDDHAILEQRGQRATDVEGEVVSISTPPSRGLTKKDDYDIFVRVDVLESGAKTCGRFRRECWYIKRKETD